MSDLPVVDPYGGLREQWPVAVLNGASQRSNIVFRKPAIRAMPVIDQKTFPDAAHFEICGFDELCSCAYAVGYIDDAPGTLAKVLADARSLGYNPATGSNTAELLKLAARQGWDCYEDDTASGDLDQKLLAAGQVGLAALNTAYGSGALWDTLHPRTAADTGRTIGHYEGIGAVNGGSYQMNPAKEESLDQEAAWKTFEGVLGRNADPASFAWALGVARMSHTDLLWAMINGPEYKASGGLLGWMARTDAELAAIKAELALDEAQLAKVAAAGQAAVDQHVGDATAAVARLQAEMAEIAAAASGVTASTPPPAAPAP